MTYKHKINYYETDKMGVTHHSNYIRIMEETRLYFLDEIGFGYEKMEADGIVSPVVSVKCDYRHPTTYADIIDVYVCVRECKKLKLTLDHKMMLGDKLVCTGESVHCFLDADRNPVSLEKTYPELYRILSEYACK